MQQPNKIFDSFLRQVIHSFGMLCNKLCEKLKFGNKAYVKGAKHCLGCNLYIITESALCACCGSPLGYTVRTPPDFRRSHRYSNSYIPREY